LLNPGEMFSKLMPVAVLSLAVHLPGCSSLKEKRSRLLPLLTRLHREFNISVAEIDHQDVWQSAQLACAAVNTDAVHLQRSLSQVSAWIEKHWPDVTIVDDKIEVLL